MKWRLMLKYSLGVAAALTVVMPTFAGVGPDKGEAEYMFREEKHVSKSFKVSPGVSVDLENKYGQVVFTSWDKDSVRFEVEIISEGDKPLKVDENLDAVEIRFTGNSSYVEARTQWASSMGLFKRSVAEIRQSINGAQRVKINYTVYLPEDADINVENHFGDVYLSDLDGVLNADISHGNLRAHSVKKIRRLKIRYGDVRIQEARSVNMDAAFGDVELGKIGTLDLSSSTSDVLIETVEDLSMISKNDKVHVQNVGVLSGSYALSNLKISNIEDRADMTTRFGSVYIKSMSADFERINIKGSFTDYTIITNEGINAKFTVQFDGADDFSYGRNVSVNDKNTESKLVTFAGNIGSGGDQRITIETTRGKVRFEM